MKKKELYSVFAVCLMMLSSCLGDTNTQITVGEQEAVYQVQPDRGLIIKDGRLLYSSQISSLSADGGDCFLVEYSFDSSSPQLQNSDSLSVTLMSTTEVDLWNLDDKPSGDAVLEDEQLTSSIQKRMAYIRGRLFLWTNLREPRSQRDSFIMSYDPANMFETADGKRTYNLYLRAVKKAVDEGDETAIALYYPNAFNIEEYFNEIRAKEEAQGGDTLRIAVKFASRFNKDTTQVEWTTSDPFEFPLKDAAKGQ